YIDQVILEDKLLQVEIEKKNLRVCKKNWADREFDWRTTKYVIFRTTWDYFERFDEFFLWIEMTKEKTIFINSLEIIKWNIDKHYLKFLQKKGINIAPTTFIEKNDCKSLSKLFIKSKWEKAVLKPAISGAARNTFCITKQNYTDFEDIFNKLIAKESMLLQEYLSDITLNGEISLIMIGGEYTHAVRKIAKKGDFRVQDDHGGKVIKYNAKASEIKFANKCLGACPYKTTYARVDIIYDNKKEPSLSELELIEPELWFRNNKSAASLLAKEIKRLVRT
ncbi:MAG: hypothetical protein P8P82_03935, partial [Flavobacteriales bacterium]|nr:hypothetical protein [Flavobacteriales bacterium]